MPVALWKAEVPTLLIYFFCLFFSDTRLVLLIYIKQRKQLEQMQQAMKRPEMQQQMQQMAAVMQNKSLQEKMKTLKDDPEFSDRFAAAQVANLSMMKRLVS
jgi:hypothetical protein